VAGFYFVNNSDWFLEISARGKELGIMNEELCGTYLNVSCSMINDP